MLANVGLVGCIGRVLGLIPFPQHNPPPPFFPPYQALKPSVGGTGLSMLAFQATWCSSGNLPTQCGVPTDRGPSLAWEEQVLLRMPHCDSVMLCRFMLKAWVSSIMSTHFPKWAAIDAAISNTSPPPPAPHPPPPPRGEIFACRYCYLQPELSCLHPPFLFCLACLGEVVLLQSHMAFQIFILGMNCR